MRSGNILTVGPRVKPLFKGRVKLYVKEFSETLWYESTQCFKYRLTNTNIKFYTPDGDYYVAAAESMQDTIKHVMQDDAEHMVGEKPRVDPTFQQGFSEDADIKEFLSRGVKISSSEWLPGNDLHVSFNPWELFLNNTAITKKLDNYHMLRGSLKVTFMINGTPQHAGLLLASYSYLELFNEIAGVGAPFDDQRLVTRSQRPHVFLNPTSCKGGCLCLPFFWQYNYLDLQSGSYPLGTIHIDSFQPLTLLDSKLDGVTISVFAHMEDVVLTVPTLDDYVAAAEKVEKPKRVKMKRNDEYSMDGPISKPASAVAAIAADLSSAPIIGPFALATQIGAEAVAGIASVFGFSKPSEISDGKFMRNTPNHAMANGDGSDTVQKLSLTRKQEITIDPTTVGLAELDDVMAISKIASVPSYFAQFNWSPSDVVGDWLFTAGVTPKQIRTGTTGSLVDYIVPTACAYASRPFGYWSGSLIFRFRIVGSAFTRGRLAIVYEPNEINSSTNNIYNTNYLAIIDISDSKDIDVPISWAQVQPYLPLSDADDQKWIADGSQPKSSSCNGVLGVQVLNELVQPDNLTEVSINVFISAGDDFEVANPLGIDPTEGFTAAGEETTAQPQEDAPEHGDTEVTLGAGEANIDYKALVFFGERIGSFREMIKRYSYSKTFNLSHLETANTVVQFDLTSLPGYRSSTFKVPSNLIQYITASHAAWRGGVRYKINTQNDVIINMFVDRQVSTSGDDFTFQGRFPISNSSSVTATAELTNVFNNTSTGIAYTTSVMPTLEYEIPYARNARYTKTARTKTTTTADAELGYVTRLSFITTPAPGSANAYVYVAAAEDYQVFGYVGAPVLYDVVP